MNPVEIMREVSEENGLMWNTDSKLYIFSEFVMGQATPEEFRKFCQSHAFYEKSISEEVIYDPIGDE